MPDRSSKLERLVVSFHRDDREIESEVAPSGERALKIGLLMLARLDDLQAGDTLTCHADEAQSAAVLRGPGGGR